MKILVMGAGAIGSFFGGLLSKNNRVVLVGRKDHVEAIKKNKLLIKGKTNLKINVSAVTNTKEINFYPDLILLTVKAFDTEEAMMELSRVIKENTFVMSLQNGLDNLEKISNYVPKERILAGVTTNGVIFSEPGKIIHTGEGDTIIGGLNLKKKTVLKDISDIFNKANLRTFISDDIVRNIWIKAIINSSINPVTACFKCKNGYLLKNPVLKKVVKKVCKESTKVACSRGFNLSGEGMVEKTFDVIEKTSENQSSMLQSIKKGKRTELDSITGKIVKIAKSDNIDVNMNHILLKLVKMKVR